MAAPPPFSIPAFIFIVAINVVAECAINIVAEIAHCGMKIHSYKVVGMFHSYTVVGRVGHANNLSPIIYPIRIGCNKLKTIVP